TGSAGHVTKPLSEKLLAAGHDVTVIGRNAENVKPLTDKGAKAALGSVEDVKFLQQTFSGVDAVYTMVPPYFGAADWKSYIEQIGKNYAEAIKASGVKYAVNLSSVGAHLPHGCGTVSGLYRVEKILNELDGVHIKHLRPGYFFQNFLSNVSMVKHMNILGGNFGPADTEIMLAEPDDIAEAAAEELQNLNFTGHSVRYIASDERTTGDIAKVLGTAIGKPDLPWVAFSDEQTLGGMQQAGLPEEVARNYTEMGAAIRSGIFSEDYWANRPRLSKTKLEDFAPAFAAAYNAS
ncbi:MAG: NmrA family NAD(P)-binding protein, partial [Bacteroidota bacterium]|nr:NmrA family NAD(P)-binding protein [Bacteroidota bacterium]